MEEPIGERSTSNVLHTEADGNKVGERRNADDVRTYWRDRAPRPPAPLPTATAMAPAASNTRLCVWISASGPVLAETLARECASTADCLLVDNQHGAFGTDAALQVLAAITGRVKHAAVRISEVGDAETCKFLDAGASVVVAPMINTRADAERFVRACMYPPAGVRSFGPYRQK